MITVSFYRNNDEIRGFKSIGHAGYAEHGKDIICAGVSALVINYINSIEKLTSMKFKVDSNAKTGMIDFRLKGTITNDARILTDSLILGLKGIQKNYGNEYIILNFKEV